MTGYTRSRAGTMERVRKAPGSKQVSLSGEEQSLGAKDYPFRTSKLKENCPPAPYTGPKDEEISNDKPADFVTRLLTRFPSNQFTPISEARTTSR